MSKDEMRREAISEQTREDLVKDPLAAAIFAAVADIIIKYRTDQEIIKLEAKDKVLAKQAAGIAAAKASGVKLGRPESPVCNGFEDLVKKWRLGRIKADEAAEQAGISVATFYRRAKGVQEG